MASEITGPCWDSDIEPDQYKSFVWESHIRQQIFSSKETKSSLVFDNIYPENNQHVPRQR